jgi:hypothetical protein
VRQREVVVMEHRSVSKHKAKFWTLDKINNGIWWGVLIRDTCS